MEAVSGKSITQRTTENHRGPQGEKKGIHLEDEEGVFYLGDTLRDRIPLSKDRDELVGRLNDPSWNILYAGAYLRMIQNHWKQSLSAPWNEHRMVGIVATVYSVGLTTHHGTVRPAHEFPLTNRFGDVAQEFFDSMAMAVELPP